MRWSLRILRVAGIGIYVHITFLLLPLWIGFAQLSMRSDWTDLATTIAFVFILFGIVVLHELGHALAAKRFGIRTRDITLLPIGGVARLERIPEDPKEELVVALAGPAVNVCLAVVLWAILGAGAQLTRLAQLDQVGGDFLALLMWVNVGLAIFNLVPAFPMDGGRVFRALLALRMNYVRATNLAASVGQTIALVFGFVGLSSIFFGHLGPISNPFLLLIALFVWVGARAEAGAVQMKSTLQDVPLSALMITEFQSLSPTDPLSSAAEHLLTGWQHDFPVLENGRIVGLLTRRALIDGLAQKGQEALVNEAMLQVFPTIEPEASAESAWSRLQHAANGPTQTVLALREGRLVGIITGEKLNQYFLIRAALRGAPLSNKAPAIPERQAA